MSEKLKIYRMENDFEKEVVADRIFQARILLFILAIFVGVKSVVAYIEHLYGIGLIINIILSVAFLVLALLVKYKPFIFLLIGGILFIGLMLLDLENPYSLLSGAVFKIIFTFGFARAIYSAYTNKM